MGKYDDYFILIGIHINETGPHHHSNEGLNIISFPGRFKRTRPGDAYSPQP